MSRLLPIIFLIAFVCSCEQQEIVKTPEMAMEARNTVLDYLTNNQLPHKGLELFKSSAQPTADFSFLYKGAGRCIEFIVNCHGQSCKDLAKYPFDEHGEQCP
jgi:hypothetical protein